MPTPGRIYYGSTLIYDDKNILSFPQAVERSAQVTVTANASANTKGAWTELIASTDGDATWLYVNANLSAANTLDTSFLLDIGTGAASSETVRIANIGIGFRAAQSAGYIFPIYVPSGTRIAARAQSNSSGRAGVVTVTVLNDPTTAALPTTLDTIGADTAASRGTNLVTSDTYVQLTASTSQAYQALVACHTGSITTWATESSTYTIATGPGGSEQALWSYLVATTLTEQMFNEQSVFSTVYIGDIPAGTRLAVKQSTGRSWRDVILYGVPYA